MKKNPNPQGKGVVPLLDTLSSSRALVAAIPKKIDQISSELFTSLFVLHSRFQFKPVVGKSYFLYQRSYQKKIDFHLSLISPQEWDTASSGMFIGECILQDDITWSLSLDAEAAHNQTLMALIAIKRDEFENMLDKANTVEDSLPFYLEKLPFYQRVYASALANSLQASMNKSGLLGLSYSQARKNLLSDKSDD